MHETHKQGWKLEELAQQAGVSPRTVRYYVQRGLLPAPVFRGRDTVYAQVHLLRLQVIRRLQAQFLPLDVIQREIERAAPEELQALAAGHEQVQALPEPTMHARHPAQTRPQSEPAPTVLPDTRWSRWVLAIGLELHLAETADAATRRHAEELLVEFQRRLTGGTQS